MLPYFGRAMATSSTNKLEGFLFKANRAGKWQKRWFVLEGGKLRYYQSEGGRVKGVVKLTEATGVCLGTVVTNPPEAHCFRVALPSRTFNFSGESYSLVLRWMESLREEMRRSQKVAGLTVASASLFLTEDGASAVEASISRRASSPNNTAGRLARRLSERLSLPSMPRRVSSSSSHESSSSPVAGAGAAPTVHWRGELCLEGSSSEPWVVAGNVLSTLSPSPHPAFVIGLGTECVEPLGESNKVELRGQYESEVPSVMLVLPSFSERLALVQAVEQAVGRATAAVQSVVKYQCPTKTGALCAALESLTLGPAALAELQELSPTAIAATTIMTGWLRKKGSADASKWQDRFFRLQLGSVTHAYLLIDVASHPPTHY